ncbi:MAG: DegT/DnrJ/EryC1/StrS aminotransferase family protein [Acidobacteria bacterium]|nr:DegT/DnrJ/EryC1/StrS aminotransferase family protein [Acidobacteriota bacterium]
MRTVLRQDARSTMTIRWSPHPRYRLYTRFASYLPQVKEVDGATGHFEAEVCRRFNVAAAACVPRARTGIYLALLEAIQPGQKVIMSPLTIVDVVNAVLLAGGIPVFCDICRASCSIDPDKAESLIDGQTGAILITHLHGQTARARVFLDICMRRGVRLIEDAAQAFGAMEHGWRLGTIGDAGIYSFGFFKNLSTWRGGMVVSNDRKLIGRIRNHVHKFSLVSRRQLLMTTLSGMIVDISTWPPIFSKLIYPVVRRNNGLVNRWLDPEARARRLKRMPTGYLHRMREWQALVGLRQLDRVEPDTYARTIRAKQYHDGLDGLSRIIKAQRADDLSNIYTYFPIQIGNRQSVLHYAQERGRDFAAQHLRNCADLPEFRELYRDCPNARATASELIILPTYPRYPAAEVQLNIEVIQEFVRRQSQ